jgi:glycosyltransferase involved in cell wall biosynthesis
MTTATRPLIAVISTVHDTYDTRIFYKQIASLRRCYRVIYFSPVAGAPEQDWIVPLYKSSSKLGRLRTHFSLIVRLQGVRADLYLLHDPELLPLGIVMSALGKKVVWDMHEDTYNDIFTKSYLAPVIRRLVAWVYLLMQSLAYRVLKGFILAEDLYGNYFVGSTKTRVVHNYPLLDRLSEVGEVVKQPNSLVYIGSIGTNRGVYQLLETVAKLRARIPAVRLILIGPFTDRALEEKVRRLIRERRIEGNVEIRGPVKNLEAYPIVARCMVGLALLLPEPNYTKSLPTKMFEYMALGLPVVVSDFPLWKGIVERDEAGFALDPRDTDAVAEKIHSILTDEGRYSTLSRNARKAASRYSWETESAALLLFVSGLLTE